MVELWRLWGGGMSGHLLPEPGGTLDQPVAMIAAFRVMDAAAAEVRRTRGGGS